MLKAQIYTSSAIACWVIEQQCDNSFNKCKPYAGIKDGYHFWISLFLLSPALILFLLIMPWKQGSAYLEVISLQNFSDQN